MDDLLDGHDAVGVAEAIRRGDVGAHEVVEHALRRIDDRNPSINAIAELRADAALADAARATGPLAGVPFVTKDLGVDVAGMRSTSGSRLRAGVVAKDDSAIVARYRAAGLVIVATTTTAEYGRSPSTEALLYGPTRNPHGLDRSVGGSSGGTAAAVASGMVPVGHGNDGGGSIRIPAAVCGLVGLKPTRGRTPSYPRRTAFAYPVGINHVLARSVRDTALLLDLTAGPVPGDSFTAAPPLRPFADEVGAPPGRQRVAVSVTAPDGSQAHDEAAAATRRVGRLLESLGHDVEEATPTYPVEALRDVMRVVMSVSVTVDVDTTLTALGRSLTDDDLEPFTRVIYENGKAATGSDVHAALQQLEHAGHVLAPFFERHDLLLTPTMPVPTPPIGLLDTTNVEAMYQHAGAIASLTAFGNVTGQPAISLPMARYADGMPLGIQLVAGIGREDLLLRVSSQLEQAEPWSIRPAWPAVPLR